MLGVSLAPRLPGQGDGPTAEQEGGFFPRGFLGLCLHQTLPMHPMYPQSRDQGVHGCAGRAAPARWVQSLQPPLGLAPWGGWGAPGIVPFPLIRRQSRCLSKWLVFH